MNSNQEHGGQQARERLLSSWMVFLCRCLQLLKTWSLYNKFNAPCTVEMVIDRWSQGLQYLEARPSPLISSPAEAKAARGLTVVSSMGKVIRAHQVSGCGAATPRWLVPLIPPAPPLPRGLWAPILVSYCSSFLPTRPGFWNTCVLLPRPSTAASRPPPRKANLPLCCDQAPILTLHFPGISHPHLHHLSWPSAPHSPQPLHCRIPAQHRPSVKTQLWWLNECILHRSTHWAGVAWCHWTLTFCKSLVWFPEHKATLQ